LSKDAVFRLVRRRVKPGCVPAYEALVRAMFEEARRFPGYLSAEMIPPETPGGEYQIIQRFATADDPARWNASAERLSWLEKLAPVADGEPEYRLLHGLDAWFGPAAVPVGKPPARWRLTIVSWLGIYPTVAALLIFVAPYLEFLPALLRIAVITGLVAVLMAYVIMPRLTRWLGPWIRR
jgi:antibiotic biosynthesis monooxygenase (ABM) superfamily enzyme